jgi:hypothetical protein
MASKASAKLSQSDALVELNLAQPGKGPDLNAKVFEGIRLDEALGLDARDVISQSLKLNDYLRSSEADAGELATKSLQEVKGLIQDGEGLNEQQQAELISFVERFESASDLDFSDFSSVARALDGALQSFQEESFQGLAEVPSAGNFFQESHEHPLAPSAPSTEPPAPVGEGEANGGEESSILQPPIEALDPEDEPIPKEEVQPNEPIGVDNESDGAVNPIERADGSEDIRETRGSEDFISGDESQEGVDESEASPSPVEEAVIIEGGEIRLPGSNGNGRQIEENPVGGGGLEGSGEGGQSVDEVSPPEAPPLEESEITESQPIVEGVVVEEDEPQSLIDESEPLEETEESEVIDSDESGGFKYAASENAGPKDPELYEEKNVLPGEKEPKGAAADKGQDSEAPPEAEEVGISFEGDFSEYEVSYEGNAFTIHDTVEGRDGDLVVSGEENFEFADKSFSSEELSAEVDAPPVVGDEAALDLVDTGGASGNWLESIDESDAAVAFSGDSEASSDWTEEVSEDSGRGRGRKQKEDIEENEDHSSDTADLDYDYDGDSAGDEAA